MELRSKNILLISPERWGDNFVSKHHYALQLSKRNNRVYFINPPSSDFGLQKISEQLTVVDYKPMTRGINFFPAPLRDLIAVKDVKYLLRLLNLHKVDVVWSFDPFRFQNLNLFGAYISIYHTVDVHDTKLEFAAAKNADVILAVSEKILDKFSMVNKPKYKINHGLADHFLKFGEKNLDITDQHKIKIGYIGNLCSFLLDVPVFIEIIKNNPKVEFYFVGPYDRSNISGSGPQPGSNFVSFLKRSENCILLGPKDAVDLPQYIQEMDAFLMCYKSDKRGAKISNSHKTLEYLSTGKVVISNYIDEYKDKSDLLEMTTDNNILAEKFKEVISNLEYYNSEEIETKRKAYASQNTYNKQIERIETIISNLKD